jgi:hypothetical protein
MLQCAALGELCPLLNVRYLTSTVLRIGLFALVYALSALVIDPHQTGSLHILPASVVDDRTPKTQLFKRFAGKGPVEGLILGSSRTLMISPRLLREITGLRYFNFAASGASVSDISSIYEGVLRYGLHPQHLVVGLDINWLMGRTKVEERQRAIAEGAMVARGTQLLIDIRSIYNSDFGYDMLRSLAFTAGLLKFKAENAFDVDGTRLSRGATFRSEYEYLRNVRGCAATMHAQFARYDLVSNLRFAEWERFVSRASADGAAVDIFVTPFNPIAEQDLTEGTLYKSLRRDAMIRLARELGPFHFALHDFGDASSFQAEVAGWSDCVHYDARIADRIVREMFPSGRH